MSREWTKDSDGWLQRDLGGLRLVVSPVGASCVMVSARLSIPYSTCLWSRDAASNGGDIYRAQEAAFLWAFEFIAKAMHDIDPVAVPDAAREQCKEQA